jgi:hypothetical protein
LHQDLSATGTDEPDSPASDVSPRNASPEFASEDRFLILQHQDLTFGVRVRRVDTVRLPDEAEPLDPELTEDLLLHPSMEFEAYKFRVIELGHLVERLRSAMFRSLRM